MANSPDTNTGRFDAKAACSVREFCASHGISRALFYQLVRRGLGPRIMKVAGRTLISSDAAADWRRAMESTRKVA